MKIGRTIHDYEGLKIPDYYKYNDNNHVCYVPIFSFRNHFYYDGGQKVFLGNNYGYYSNIFTNVELGEVPFEEIEFFSIVEG